MPIEVLRDLKTKYNLNWDFGIRQLRDPKSLSLLDGVRDDIADQNWSQFIGSIDPFHAQRDAMRRLAYQFHCSSEETDIFNDLNEVFTAAHDYQATVEGDLEDDLEIAYEYLARTAAAEIDYVPQGRAVINKPTFSRVIDRDDDKFVIFSDHHMTAHKDASRNFFEANYKNGLYLSVLEEYFKAGYVVVENGDVEECVIYEPNSADAEEMRKLASKAKFPIARANEDWPDFITSRYKARQSALEKIIDKYSDYYDLVKSYALNGQYIRLCGNHDTYLWAWSQDEKVLADMVHDKLGLLVQDVLRIARPSNSKDTVRYIIMHGHQFDPVCMQHGAIAFASSLGETFSESQGWAFEGADRYWTTQDTKKWYNGTQFVNELSTSSTSSIGLEEAVELLFASEAERKSQAKSLVEGLVGHHVAWEYFENADAYNALMLEVWRGDEWLKMRHLDEVTLCSYYVQKFLDVNAKGQPMPTLIIGHTHEPRLNAVSPENGNEYTYYLNSGSTGRYENLIWCIEIVGNDASLRSWSYVDGTLKGSYWKPDGGNLYRS